MEKKTNISQLPETQGVSKNDLLIIQNPFVTSSIKFENFILGPENVSFYKEIKDMQSDVDSLRVASISATDTIQSLSTVDPGPGGDKSIMYVKEVYDTAGFETGGMYIFDLGAVTAGNGATIIDPTSAQTIGRWKRTGYDYIDPRWFGASISSTDNQSALQAALDFSTQATVNKPVKVPNGTFITSGLSANGPGAHIIGSGNSILRAKSDLQENSLVTITSDNCIIENIELAGGDVDSVTRGVNNINVNNADDVMIRNCRIHAAAANNIILINTKRCRVTENQLYNANGNNIHIYATEPGGSERNVICNNIINSATAKDILEAGNALENSPDYNIITSNICNSVTNLTFTGQHTVRALNAHDDSLFTTTQLLSTNSSGESVPIADPSTSAGFDAATDEEIYNYMIDVLGPSCTALNNWWNSLTPAQVSRSWDIIEDYNYAYPWLCLFD